jgi:glycosyltransferase involved in cell wall biosynthesis
MKISLILPIYNEQEILGQVLENYKTDLKNICRDVKGVSYEIIAVNDGCTDASVDILMKEGKLNRSLRIVNLKEHFGKQAAITAGFEAAEGDLVIVADIDLLNPTGVLQNMVIECLAGNPIVYAYREHIGKEKVKHAINNFLVRFSTRMFNIPGSFVGKANIMLFTRDVADILKELPEKNKLLRYMDNWVGYEIASISYASSYSREEIREKVAAAKRRAKEQGLPDVMRSRARDHTPTKIYAIASVFTAVMFLVTWIVLAIEMNFGFFEHLVLTIAFISVIFASILFYVRSVMIKRIGLVHNDLSSPIYIIESVVN